MGADWRSTGLPSADARDDFTRARRRAAWAKVIARLSGRPGDLDFLLPYDEVVAALGQREIVRLGLQTVELDTIVGSTDRVGGFDRHFRPTSGESRERFERLAAAARRGESFPPVDLYRVGKLHFVRDGHHRVAVARALDWKVIPAYVTEVRTAIPASPDLTLADLPLKGSQRVFFERVPLSADKRAGIRMRLANDYMLLAEGVEAWAFRVMVHRAELLDRRQAADLWWTEEYQPAIQLLREEGLISELAGDDPGLTDAEAYLRFSEHRYRLLRTHDWTERAVEMLREDPPPPVSLTRRERRSAAGSRGAS
ncbi:MAG: chromosome partitioning protein ParB [Mycobacterium sp.]|nr:chromosome partitioning protein ParB [Mycobacterium sp.]